MTAAFGLLPDGRQVHRLTLAAGDLTVSILTLGAILNDLRHAAAPFPLTLGTRDLAAYLGPMAYYGAIVGPVANRIAGATAQVGGKTLTLIANERGRTTLHGGPAGTHGQIWKVAEHAPDRARLTLDLPDGAEGWPGNRHITATYRLAAPAMLQLELTANTDAPTLINLANHSYWSLGPNGLQGHRLHIPADRYTPVDADLIPTGAAPVEGTAFDFRTTAPVGPEAATRLDHNFCLADARRDTPALACRLTGPTGVTLTIETTEPGLQVYDAARNDTTPFDGYTRAPYGPFSGVALEAQCWPDAPHHPDFPSVELLPGQTYRQVTRWTIAT